MAKRNWFDSIEDIVPAVAFDEFNLPAFKNGMNLAKTLFTEPFDLDNVNEHITPFDDFMAAFDGFGFKDKGDHYEMVTGLGGHEAAEDAVKVELTGKNNRTVEITYEHSTSTDENNFYSHSQKTSATLPAEADEETIKAYFDEKGNVVVSVKKKAKEPIKKGPRQIPVGVRHKDE